MSRSRARFILPALLVLGAGYCIRSRVPTGSASVPVSASASASPEAQLAALLDGLAVGQMIGEWKVIRMYPEAASNQQPQIAIDFERKGSSISVYLARREVARLPPITTERYAISFGHLRPEGEPIPPGSDQRMGEEIAARVRRNEQTAPVPSAL